MNKKTLFKESKTIILPCGIIKKLTINELTNALFVTDIGYYKKAKNHYTKRKKGCNENILLYCTDGKGWVEIDHKKQSLSKNEYIIISQNTPHKYGSNIQNPWSIYWIHFIGSKANLFINHPNEKVEINLNTNSRYNDRILLFEEIFKNLEMGYSVDNLEYANICLWHMLGSFRYLSQFRKINEYHKHDRIEKSISFMKEHITEKLSLEKISSHVDLSISQFSLLFKQRTSTTPLEYLTNLRIQQASNLLDFSSLRINEIASLVGYKDPLYFSRIFSKIMGKSPKIYRKLKKD